MHLGVLPPCLRPTHPHLARGIFAGAYMDPRRRDTTDSFYHYTTTFNSSRALPYASFSRLLLSHVYLARNISAIQFSEYLLIRLPSDIQPSARAAFIFFLVFFFTSEAVSSREAPSYSRFANFLAMGCFFWIWARRYKIDGPELIRRGNHWFRCMSANWTGCLYNTAAVIRNGRRQLPCPPPQQTFNLAYGSGMGMQSSDI
jgi:hypothetical protein